MSDPNMTQIMLRIERLERDVRALKETVGKHEADLIMISNILEKIKSFIPKQYQDFVSKILRRDISG